MAYYGQGYLIHFGIKGQKWGRRRFQEENGTLTAEGRERYLDEDGNVKKQDKQDKRNQQKTPEEIAARNKKVKKILIAAGVVTIAAAGAYIAHKTGADKKIAEFVNEKISNFGKKSPSQNGVEKTVKALDTIKDVAKPAVPAPISQLKPQASSPIKALDTIKDVAKPTVAAPINQVKPQTSAPSKALDAIKEAAKPKIATPSVEQVKTYSALEDGKWVKKSYSEAQSKKELTEKIAKKAEAAKKAQRLMEEAKRSPVGSYHTIRDGKWEKVTYNKQAQSDTLARKIAAVNEYRRQHPATELNNGQILELLRFKG